MEDLNKHQLILLTLLVSFVTSIATGIITFTLLQEAPVEVTNTINRVVEKTIEQVTPTDNTGKTVVKEVQVVNEEDLVLKSIDQVGKSVVRVKTHAADGNEIMTGLGIVVSDGVVAIDSRSYSTLSNYTVVTNDGKEFKVSKTYNDGNLVFFKLDKSTEDKYVFTVAVLGNADALKLGQTVIAIAGKLTNSVSIGRVSELSKDSSNNLAKIVTEIPVSKSQIGSPLLNLSSEIVGIELPLAEGDSIISYAPVSILKAATKDALAQFSK